MCDCNSTFILVQYIKQALNIINNIYPPVYLWGFISYFKAWKIHLLFLQNTLDNTDVICECNIMRLYDTYI
jgi:hypothetical protein